ncbi:MAG TPA: sugar nucleotide-binding protein [Thermoleophilaceae bacterium]|nr:sugar nucleotide-binding protein [Thermoleophilaceae bacterium]
MSPVRVYLTGATGFLGGNVARVFAGREGAELFCPVHRMAPPEDAPYAWERLDLTDAAAVERSVASFRPDAIVHAAIRNDLLHLYADRVGAWEAYVGATRNLVDAANRHGAHMVLVSTDWVFDGTQSGATEDTPPNPINLYGFLKAASELVVTQRADRSAVARVAAVNGVHLARPAAPRRQDAGFGYLVGSLVESLRAGRPFAVWESPAINMVATPTLASDAAGLLWRIAASGHEGIFHCCGGESVDRGTLARLAVEAFDLDGDLLQTGVPYPDDPPPAPVPFDTSLDARATAERLGVELPTVRDQLGRMRAELESVEAAA